MIKIGGFILTYDLKPKIKITKFDGAWQGYEAISHVLMDRVKSVASKKIVLAVECYPGVDLVELETELLAKFTGAHLICADNYAYAAEIVTEMIKKNMTDDRVFGVMSHATCEEFFPEYELEQLQKKIQQKEGLTIVYGTGATLVAPNPDILIYADLARWEIQGRFRAGLPNWKANNATEEPLKKFKRGFFFEWRMADRLKQTVANQIDFLLDTNQKNKPKMVGGEDYREALKKAVTQPFRLVPYFDESVWGGQWMKERFNLDPTKQNYGWAFDGIPEENSVLLEFGEVLIEIPAINLVKEHPNELLGQKVHARFGKEFPIRFDYLDTVGGGNLSLQVHPLVDYIQTVFGMTYTQNESYYILEANQDSTIYLGVKEGILKEDLVADLKKAAEGNFRFPDEKYINCFPVKKHDHYSIPAGTIHCGGPETVVLEISQTPYIFTFKLWDWERVGLDGVPRPVHIDHGAKNIQMDYNTSWVQEHLINPFSTLIEEESYKMEKTGLYELEFIETRRHWFDDSAIVSTNESVNMLNLVEGEQITVESLDGSFSPYMIHYGETFIVPAQIKEYRLVNHGKNRNKVAVIQAFVKNL